MSLDEEIAVVRDRWAEALNEGSADGFVGCVTDDAVWLPPAGDAVEGIEALRAWLQGLFDQFRYEFKISDVQVRLVGDDRAVEGARFRSVLRPRSGEGEPMIHDGRYLLLWRRSGSRGWRIERYVDRTEQRG